MLPGRGETFTRVLEGPEHELPVVLLHGWTATADLNFLSLYDSLRGRRTVVAPDLRGHGRGLLSEESFSLEDCADDTAALLAELGIERTLVVGYSMGTAVTQLLIARHPDLVAGAVFGAAGLEWRTHRLQRIGMRIVNRRAAMLRATEGRWLAHRLVSRAAKSLPDAGQWRPWVVAELERGHGGALRGAGIALGEFDGRPMAEACECPTASVITTKDLLVRPKRQREFASLIGANTFELAGDHDSPVALAGDFARVVCEALDDVVRRLPARQVLDRAGTG
jgi:pimeloyl-ACP methyl ester carboxylesterase